MMVSFSPSTSPSTSYAPQPQPSPVTFHDIDSTVLADDDSVIDRLMLGCKGLLGTQIARECGLFGGEDGEDEDDDDEVAIYGLRYKVNAREVATSRWLSSLMEPCAFLDSASSLQTALTTQAPGRKPNAS